MVFVPPALCVDRFEAHLVDVNTGARLSPYYPPEGPKAVMLERRWRELAGTGTELEHATKLPELPAHQRRRGAAARAVSAKGAVPQGYASGKDAGAACERAGKRLCTRAEWVRACRGEADRPFPYGARYEQGRCNVFREAHPALLLWGDPSRNHTDPRLNLVSSSKGPLLRRTGATASCASRWGDDAIFDMVGNLDEWVDDPEGTFLGGFYARSKKDGCASAVSSHGVEYADYSTGIRCCRDAAIEGESPPTSPSPSTSASR
jgi:formylglycine-generating enzyme required for sulfatase activity